MTVKFMTPALTGLLLSLRSAAAKLARDKRGNAAIEFAVIVPLMLTMFFGVVEFSSGVAVQRKVSMAAQELADMASRNKSVGDTDMTNFFNVGKAVLTPYIPSPLNATITQIYVDPATGVARSQWSKGTVPRADASAVPLPANLVARDAVTNVILPNQYFIFSETSYLYQPAVGYIMAKAGINLKDQTYMRPRLQTCVYYSPATACTTK
jgi:Flp pilus assembly protein TadG